MMRALGTSPLLIPFTVLLLGCVSGRRGESLPPLPAAWSVPACYIADTFAVTADTLYVVRAPSADSLAPATNDCGALRNRPSGSGSPVIIPLAVPTDMDLRDVLDLGAVSADGRRVLPDVVVARDPDVIAYARRRGFLASALAWERTYVLTSRASALSSGTTAAIMPTAAERDALARDAITADSRGAAEPFAWRTDTTCALPQISNRAAPAPFVAYAADDRTARQLAERVVSLARMQPQAAWVTVALSELDNVGALRVVALPVDSIMPALESGEVAAAILVAPRDPRARCGTRGEAPIPAGAVPLVDTRAHVIIRRGSGAAILATPDGAIRIVRRRAP